MQLKFTHGFDLSYKKIAKNDQKLKLLVKKRLKQYLTNPKHPSLRMHKIEKGEYWSISVNKSIRILLFFSGKTTIFFNIGKHEDVY